MPFESYFNPPTTDEQFFRFDGHALSTKAKRNSALTISRPSIGSWHRLASLAVCISAMLYFGTRSVSGAQSLPQNIPQFAPVTIEGLNQKVEDMQDSRRQNHDDAIKWRTEAERRMKEDEQSVEDAQKRQSWDEGGFAGAFTALSIFNIMGWIKKSKNSQTVETE